MRGVENQLANLDAVREYLGHKMKNARCVYSIRNPNV